MFFRSVPHGAHRHLWHRCDTPLIWLSQPASPSASEARSSAHVCSWIKVCARSFWSLPPRSVPTQWQTEKTSVQNAGAGGTLLDALGQALGMKAPLSHNLEMLPNSHQNCINCIRMRRGAVLRAPVITCLTSCLAVGVAVGEAAPAPLVAIRKLSRIESRRLRENREWLASVQTALRKFRSHRLTRHTDARRQRSSALSLRLHLRQAIL